MEKIKQLLNEINEKILETNNVTETIFDILKSNGYKELPELNKKQIELMEDVGKLTETSKKMIAAKCEEYGVTEIRLRNLFGFMNQKTKEEILSLEKKLMKNEGNLKNNLHTNKEILLMKISTSKTMMDVISYNAEKVEGDNASVFLNQKF